MNFKSVTLVFIVSIIFASQVESKWLAPHGLVFKKMIPVRGTLQLNNRVFTLDAEKGIKSSYVQQVASQEVAKDESKPVSAEPLSDDEPTTVESVSESNPIPVPVPSPTPSTSTSTTTTTTTTTTQAPSTLPSTTSTTSTTTLPSTTSTSTTATTIATPVQPIRVISKTSPVHPSKGSSGKNQQHHYEQQQQQQQQQHHHQSSHESSHHHQSSGKTSVKTSSPSSFASPAQRARATRRPNKGFSISV